MQTDSGDKVKKWYTANGEKILKIKELYTESGTLLYKSETPIVLKVSVLNGYTVNVESRNRNSLEYIVPKGVTEIVLTGVELSKPYGSAAAYIYLNGALKANAGNFYYVGDVPGFAVKEAETPQTWKVKAGDTVTLVVEGWSNANLSNQQTTYLDVYLTLS